jgi:hypothetical protein
VFVSNQNGLGIGRYTASEPGHKSAITM